MSVVLPMPCPQLPPPPPAAASASAVQPFAKHDLNRAPRFWHVAVNATKGLFNQPTRVALDDASDTIAAPPVPRVEERLRRVRRSTSTPALKASASAGASSANTRRDMADPFSPPLPPLFTNRALEQSLRKTKNKAAARRPAISAPSLPKPLDSFDFPHPKLAYPLSPMPSPVGSTFSVKTQAIQASSKLPINQTVSDNIAADAFNDSRPARRRTKSAPGAKLGKRSLFSPALSAALESDIASFEPIVIDIASPSIASPDSPGSLPSPPLETPTMVSDSYFNHTSTPLVHAVSPRSFTSVKRKPVPRHLYTDPPAHDASAPCTPLLSPNPGSPPNANDAPRSAGSSSLHTPLLPSSELILKSCNPSRMNGRGFNLLPIGQVRSGSSARRQHRRSVSEQGYGRLLSPDTGLSLPSPWFTTNANGSMTALVTPAEEQAPFSFAYDLPAAPRVLPQSPPQTPNGVAEEISAFSDDTSCISQNGALSPLTDDEIDAIRSFLRRHATGHRARQRRKASQLHETHSRNTSIVSSSYDMHAQILESYATDEDESEDDADAESHVPMSASETHSTSAMSLLGQEESEHEDEEDGGVDVETPIDAVNRGTFGYYGTPVVRRPQSHRGSSGAYAYIPGDGEIDARPSFPPEWRERGEFSDMSQVMKTSGMEETEIGTRADCPCTEDLSEVTLVTAPPRSSSLYYRSSSDYACQEDDDSSPYLRISRQPLVPRMLSSDSESDRPLSSSSTSVSLSASTSTGPSAFASGIGLAIIPPEHFAYFDTYEKYEYVRPCSPSECGAEDDLEGSPATLACPSSSPRSQRCFDMRRDNPFDRLQTSLANLQTQTVTVENASPQRNVNIVSPMLKPALQINANTTMPSTLAQLPSPTDTVATYPPQTFASAKGRLPQKTVTPQGVHWNGVASASADEATPENMRSFMNLTPNDPMPKRSRVRLRQLFSRANLMSAAGRKASAESKS